MQAMPSNTEVLQAELYADFEAMISFVKESKTQPADQVERGIFRSLLALGAQLMRLFFALRAGQYPRTPLEREHGAPLPYWGQKKRIYFSIFGKIPFWRPYFYAPRQGSEHPLDAQLSLGADTYSDFLREVAEFLSVDMAYKRVSEVLARLFGFTLSTNALAQMVAQDAGEVEAYYKQKPAPCPETEAEILVLQADGKGVPILRQAPAQKKHRLGKGEKRTKKKEAMVTGLYTIAAHRRAPEEVVRSFFGQHQPGSRPRPQHKYLWATLEGKDTALARLAEQVQARDGVHIRARVALTDGCEALQDRVVRSFPEFTLILDFVHANEYLWKAANRLFSEQDPARQKWVEIQTLAMLSGQSEQVISTLRGRAETARKTTAAVLEKSANYFERNLPYMHYDHYLAQGWPIASGVIEGACRHLVKDRFERSGMRWCRAGAEALLGLRCVAENGDWDGYHQFRRRARHGRLYRLPYREAAGVEEQVLAEPEGARVPSMEVVSRHRIKQQGCGEQRRAA